MDIVVINGRVETTLAEAVGVREGKVAAVGTTAQVLAERRSSTKVIDAGGKVVLPGFIEPHNHMAAYQHRVQLPQRRSEALARLQHGLSPIRQSLAQPV